MFFVSTLMSLENERLHFFNFSMFRGKEITRDKKGAHIFVYVVTFLVKQNVKYVRVGQNFS